MKKAWVSYAFSFSSRKNMKGPQNDSLLENLLGFVANHGFVSARLNFVCVYSVRSKPFLGLLG